MPNSGKVNEEEYPLVPQQSYANPYLEEEELNAAMRAGTAPANAVSDGEIANSADRVLAKGQEGAAQTVQETIKDAKAVAGSIVEKDDGNAWWLPTVVVIAYLFFDVGKFLAEKQGTHGTTINVSFLQMTMCILNIIVAFTMTVVLMGGEGIRTMLDWEKLKAYIVPSAFFAIGALFNLLQNLYIDTSTRKVFAQLRIPLTALFGKFILGQGYTSLQWVMILSITVSVFQFQMMTSTAGNVFGGDSLATGLFFSVISNLCGCLGSLAGEKTMKANKKLPFYLQKFQFEVWTFVFAIVGAFVISPGTGIMLDYMKGNIKDWSTKTVFNAPKFTENWALSLSTSHATYKASALTTVPFEATYETENGEQKLTFPNRFDLGGWTTADLANNKKIAEQVLPEVEENKAYQYAELSHIVRAYVNLQNRRYNGETLGNRLDAEGRADFVDASAFAPTGRLALHSDKDYRKVSKDLMLNTKLYTTGPFNRVSPRKMTDALHNSFVFVIGNEVNGEFQPLQLLQRDSPALPSIVMKKKGETFESSVQPVEYFRVERSYEQSKDGDSQKADLEAKIKSHFNEKAHDTGDVHTRVIYSKKVGTSKVADSDRVELRYRRETRQTLKAVDKSTALEHVEASVAKYQELLVVLKCNNKPGFVNADTLEAEPMDCTVEKSEVRVLNYDDAKKDEVKPLASKLDEEEPKTLEQIAAENADPEKKEEKDKKKKQQEEEVKKFEDFFAAVASQQVTAENVPQSDDEKFRFRKTSTAAAITEGKTFKAWVYPGSVAAGVSLGDMVVCSRRMCFMEDAQFDASMGYMGWMYKDFRWMMTKDDSDIKTNPFKFAEFHAWGRKPLPAFYVLNLFFPLAVFMNAGQSWMSAYLSKVLSSLWKNICAAVALTLIVVLEKCLVTMPHDKMRTDWSKVGFATFGVIVTVFVFQMAPKAPKPEAAKKDIESKGSSKH